ncbi:MAG: D-alanyl-D-alanine carboxypeptidase/D-alanyl-D-alanine-endopeptidase [Deltaproteobacteria bacterium]|nr:D-alanyl-D-alanine carboxypeptidase/D-alanyl-D-alanine-endopeptidase [Deltaproteobacteria bacterium]
MRQQRLSFCKVHWHTRIVLGLLLVAVGVPLPAAIGQTTPPPALERLPAHYGFADEDVGYLLFDPADGRLLTAHRADEPRIPASTTKVATLIAALQILGEDYRFETSLFTTGEVKANTLYGSLYLRGGGDPTLTTDDLREFVPALRRAGITRITGSFAFDESFLARTREINVEQPVAVSYNPGLSALSVNYNRIQLRWKHKPGGAAFVTAVLSPADGGFVPVEAIDTSLLPRGIDRRIKFLHDGTAMDRWLLSPALPAQGQVELPVKADPGRLAAHLFRTLCRQQGIDLPVPQPATVPAGARILHTHWSEALPEIAAGVLRYSNNLSAELIGQVAARQLSDRPLSLRESATALADWYGRTLPDTDWHGFLSVNHSGLSSATRHSPQQLAAILRHGWTMSIGGAHFAQLLPPPPWEREDGRGSMAVRVKSGTMSYADGLVGFLTTTRGRQLGFVILITDFPKRAALDATLDVRFADPPPEARAWTERAKALEYALVTSWITCQ